MQNNKITSSLVIILMAVIGLFFTAQWSSPVAAAQQPSVQYRTHVQDYGWQNFVSNGQTSGTTGKSKRLEATTIQLTNQDSAMTGSIQYQTHIQNIGWQDWTENGGVSGTSGRSLRLEAIRIKLTGNIANYYDVYYRVHAQSFGWLGWASNGQDAGTSGYGYRLEGIEVVLVPKGQPAPGNTANAFHSKSSVPSVKYRTHVQDYGWQNFVSNGQTSGTTGKSKRLEATTIQLTNQDSAMTGSIQYQTHVQNIGWQDWTENGGVSGTSGRSLRLEAIRIKLTGNIANYYDVYYRVHAQSFGWLGWASNGQDAGTAGYGYRLEGMEVVLVPKGQPAPGNTANAFHSKSSVPSVKYRTHVQDYGWQNFVSNGQTSGTTGKSKRLEATTIQLTNQDSAMTGSIQYQTHIQNIGWQDWTENGGVSGTSGRSLRLEAIRIKLTGNIANYYDVYYRVHAQSFGWLGWASNGQDAGTSGYGYRLEGMEVVLVPKGQPAPGNTTNPFYAKTASTEQDAADKAIESDILTNFWAGSLETVGKYTKKLYVGISGTDITPFTVTSVSVSDGSNLSVTYSQEELQVLGFNTNPGYGRKFNGNLTPEQGSSGWDTSNLVVTATVRLQSGKVITVTHRVYPVSGDNIESDILTNFWAGSLETVGKYTKKLYVGISGTDITPFTVTSVSVSDGSNLSVTYSQEELQVLGFNTNPGYGRKFNGNLTPEQGSSGWDTSNLVVTATVRLQSGKVITVTHRVYPVSGDNIESDILTNFWAGSLETVGKYTKKLYVGISGTDITPFTVTSVSVSDGSNLSVTYSQEELQVLGFNTNPGYGRKFNGNLTPEQGSSGWDTSNLVVTATVRLQSGKVITVTHRVYPSN